MLTPGATVLGRCLYKKNLYYSSKS